MNTLAFAVGIVLILFGIGGLFMPGLTRLINIPGNEKIKAIGALIIGIIIAVFGYISG
jgi:uncharacterized protein YjeT (DUF2065 family)